MPSDVGFSVRIACDTILGTILTSALSHCRGDSIKFLDLSHNICLSHLLSASREHLLYKGRNKMNTCVVKVIFIPAMQT